MALTVICSAVADVRSGRVVLCLRYRRYGELDGRCRFSLPSCGHLVVKVDVDVVDVAAGSGSRHQCNGPVCCCRCSVSLVRRNTDSAKMSFCYYTPAVALQTRLQMTARACSWCGRVLCSTPALCCPDYASGSFYVTPTWGGAGHETRATEYFSIISHCKSLHTARAWLAGWSAPGPYCAHFGPVFARVTDVGADKNRTLAPRTSSLQCKSARRCGDDPRRLTAAQPDEGEQLCGALERGF